MSASPALVIFDVDGVLVDSEHLSNLELARSIAAVGGTMRVEEVKASYTGWTLRDIRDNVQQRYGPLPVDWIERFEESRNAVFRQELRAVPGAVDAVHALRAEGFAVCAASQARIEKTELSLGLAGLWDVFRDAAFSSRSVPRPKPAPDLFLHAARTMGFPPERCAIVEDTRLGIQAGLSARMTVFGYDPAGALEEVPSAVTRFCDMRTLPSLLRVWRDALPTAEGAGTT